jgi:hypothetical protein
MLTTELPAAPVEDPKTVANKAYSEVLPDLKALISSFSDERTATDTRKKRRRIEIKPEWMKEQGKMARDFAFIPIRVIDTTITREQASYVAFLKGERRIAIFKTDDVIGDEALDSNVQVLEERFTSGMTYPGWELPIVQCQDGGALHGWDAVEVVLDVSRKLHVDIEHIGHDKLIFSRDALDIQNCPNVLRMYEFTQFQLDRAVKQSGFSAEQVDLLQQKFETKTDKERTVPLYKRYFRIDGIVHVAWFSEEGCCNDWIKPPTPLLLGIKHKETSMEMQPVTDPMTGMPAMDMMGLPLQQEVPVENWVDTPLQNYPIFIYRYRITEDHYIGKTAGRGDLDKDRQEAQTALTSSYVTGNLRACHTFASPSGDGKTGQNITKLETTILEDGGIYDRPMEFWNRPFPSPDMLRGMQYLDVQHQDETSQVNFAVQNRQDSRKTATEIQAATQQQSQLSSVQVTMFSIFLREIYSFIWQIVQSRCLQGQYILVPMRQPDPMTGQITVVNNDEVVGLNFDLRAAGDFDIVQRAEKLQRMGQFLPLVQGTAALQVLLGDMLALAFPEDADKYRRALMAQPAMMQLLQTIGAGIQQLGQGEVDPAKQQVILQLLELIKQQMSGGQQPGQQAAPQQ